MLVFGAVPWSHWKKPPLMGLEWIEWIFVGLAFGWVEFVNGARHGRNGSRGCVGEKRPHQHLLDYTRRFQEPMHDLSLLH